MKRKLRRLSENKYILMGGVIGLLVLLGLVSALRGQTQAEFPFDHIYRVAHADDNSEDTPTVYLTRDGHLLLESRDRTQFSDEGRLEQEEGIWTVSPRGNVTLRWRLWLEEDDTVMLSRTEKGETVTYTLSRVDTVTCDVDSGKESDTIQIQWFAEGVYDNGKYDLVSANVTEEGTLAFRVEDPGVTTLVVTEEYHTDNGAETRTEELAADGEGLFCLSVQTRTAKNNEYAVYRVPYDGGEYIFQVNFR